MKKRNELLTLVSLRRYWRCSTTRGFVPIQAARQYIIRPVTCTRCRLQSYSKFSSQSLNFLTATSLAKECPHGVGMWNVCITIQSVEVYLETSDMTGLTFHVHAEYWAFPSRLLVQTVGLSWCLDIAVTSHKNDHDKRNELGNQAITKAYQRFTVDGIQYSISFQWMTYLRHVRRFCRSIEND